MVKDVVVYRARFHCNFASYRVFELWYPVVEIVRALVAVLQASTTLRRYES